MTQPIVRMYDSLETAHSVAEALRQRRFMDGSIHIITRPEATEETAADSVEASILATGVAPVQAPVYAEAVHRGEVLVAVQPLFGFGQTATQVMDSFHPIALEVPEPPAPVETSWSGAAPLSAKLGLPVLLSDPTPLSTWLGWRTIKPEPASSPVLERIRKQSAEAAPLSKKLGMPVLSDNPAPLSRKFNWRLLLDNPTPLSSWRKMRVLSDDPAPLSAKLGWRTLSDNAAPLSSRFGWRVLLDNPTPLSSLFGWRVLTKD